MQIKMEKTKESFFLNKKSNNTDKKTQLQKQDNKRHEVFDKNRDAKPVEKTEAATEKKPFDKKTYRLKKYSKKYKLEQWEEQRKKRLIRDYEKEIKNDNVSGTYKPISFDEDTTDSNQVGKYVRHPDIMEKENLAATAVRMKRDPFKKVKEQYNKIKQDKEKKKQEIERVKEERNQKLQEYKKKKHERYKKLSKKTKRGQPVMTGRMELLLEKIQKN